MGYSYSYTHTHSLNHLLIQLGPSFAIGILMVFLFLLSLSINFSAFCRSVYVIDSNVLVADEWLIMLVNRFLPHFFPFFFCSSPFLLYFFHSFLSFLCFFFSASSSSFPFSFVFKCHYLICEFPCAFIYFTRRVIQVVYSSESPLLT